MATTLQQVETLLPNMSPGEKVWLIQKVLGESTGLFPGIESTPGVCGGSACIIRTRIPVWSLVASKKVGFTDEELLEDYPTLRKQDLLNAWNYYLTYPVEIDREIKENDEV
jgi:uncharacterized protein (DUF433 family)